MEIIPIKTKIIQKNALDFIFAKTKKKIRNNDILVFTSKIVSYHYQCLVALKSIIPSEKARNLAKKHGVSPQFAELVIKGADKILGGVKRAILTLKNGILMANAGIDQSNMPKGYVIKLPKNIEKIADEIRVKIKKISGKKIGIVINDSVCLPLRLGTHHFALTISGFESIVDERGKKDIFGKKMNITTRNLADELASAAGLVMGERNEKIPAVIIRGLPIKFTNLSAEKLTKELLIPRNQDLFRDILKFGH